jgi:hypothetical protein
MKQNAREEVREILEELLTKKVEREERLTELDAQDIEDAIHGLGIEASLIESMAYKFDQLSPNKSYISAMHQVYDRINEHIETFKGLRDYANATDASVISRRIDDNGALPSGYWQCIKKGCTKKSAGSCSAWQTFPVVSMEGEMRNCNPITMKYRIIMLEAVIRQMKATTKEGRAA